MGYVLVTPPAAEPLTPEECSLDGRIDADLTADAALIELLITAVRQYAEHETGCSMITQTWRKVMDGFPGCAGWGTQGLDGNAVFLEKGPVQTVTGITYLDMAGTLQTMPSTDYVLDPSSQVARVAPKFGKLWPNALPQIGSVGVTFTAGYGATGAHVPEGLKKWMKLRLNTLYRNREDFATGRGITVVPLPFVDTLLDAYRIRRA